MTMYQRYKLYWFKKYFIYNVLASLLLLLLAGLANQYANHYLTTITGSRVADIFLDNLPVIDVHLIFSEGAVVFVLLLLAILLYEPKYIPFTLKSIATFFLVRSFLMILTHLAPPIGAIYINPADYISRLSSGSDLFFSAHTGLPFLMAFVFWKQRSVRYFFFFCSAVGGAAVLLGHLHYSIDVFSALFISFGIFHICKNLFPRDFELIDN